MNKPLLVFLLLTCPPALAAEPVKPPAKPYLPKELDRLSWTISYERPDAGISQAKASAASADRQQVKSIPPTVRSVVNKLGKRRHELFIRSDQSRRESWYLAGPGLELQENPGEQRFVMMMEANEDKYSRFLGLKSDFPELHWLDSATYQGTERIKGRLCHHFLRQAPRGAKENLAIARVPYLTEVWIDAAKRLPVKATGENVELTYVFQPFAGKLPKMAAGFIDMLKRKQQVAQRAKSYRMVAP